MNTTATLKRLLIRTPDAIAALHPDVDECWYEFIGADRYLRLWVGKGKYTPVYEDRDLSYQRTLSSAIAPISYALVGFEAQIEHSDLAVRDIALHLALAQTSADRRTHTPTTILDFVQPEPPPDRAVYLGEAYTRRVGRLLYPETKGGSMGWQGRNYGEGFMLKYEELQRRRMA